MITHLACIMDGNRRWARQQGWAPWDGHREGVRAAQRVVDFCLEQKISYLSLYTFSIENFSRPEPEKNFLFNILMKELKRTFIKDLIEKGVRVLFVGDRALFPSSILQDCIEIEQMTAHGAKLQVNLLFCYGGQQEIVDGMKKIVDRAIKGEIVAHDLTQQMLQQEMWTSGIPAPELIVRTGGARRLSNFLLFQAAYSEFFFLDCFWPEITSDHLQQVFKSFNETQRNFGT